MGISQAIVGMGGIIYPILIEKMMEGYGFRGTISPEIFFYTRHTCRYV